jgi:hypothetical protein
VCTGEPDAAARNGRKNAQPAEMASAAATRSTAERGAVRESRTLVLYAAKLGATWV